MLVTELAPVPGAPSGYRPAFDPRTVAWDAVAAALGDIPFLTDPALIRQKSRDFYWYSPVLKEQLKRSFGNLVVVPRDRDDVIRVAALAVERRIPLTVRGAGTGNYGQAMPLEGGIILEMTGLDRILDLSGGILRVEAGRKLLDLERETLPAGWELRLHPSTRRTATIGGFIAGGSTGVGAINYGLLRDRGNVLGLKVVTMEPQPRLLELRGDDVLRAAHAYGCNGIIVECEMPMAPAQPWADILVHFDTFERALDFADALAHADAIAKKLITPVAAPVPGQYFRSLRGHFPEEAHVVLCMVAEAALEPCRLLAADHGGSVGYVRKGIDGGEGEGGIPPLYEFTWNHTTLQALKVDKSVTYLQTLFSPENYREKIARMMATFGDEVPMHLEFVRLGGRVGCFGLQLVRYSTRERLEEIIACHEAEGCPVFNPHTYVLEDGGMKEIDRVQLDFKRAADPFGLLNPGKMRAWWQAPEE